MNRYLKIIFSIVIACAVGVGIAMSKADEAVLIERNGIALEVPKSYLHKNRFPWIDQAKGLDSGDNEFLIKIPANEIKSLLPDSVTQDKLAPIDLTVVVALMSDKQKQVTIANGKSRVSQIANRAEGYTHAHAEFDEDSGFYKVYKLSGSDKYWDYFLRSPFENKELLKGEDFLAACYKDEHIGSSCATNFNVSDRILIEFGLKGEHMPYYKKIRDYIASLLDSWRVKN